MARAGKYKKAKNVVTKRSIKLKGIRVGGPREREKEREKERERERERKREIRVCLPDQK
jgi:hypothetical protein